MGKKVRQTKGTGLQETPIVSLLGHDPNSDPTRVIHDGIREIFDKKHEKKTRRRKLSRNFSCDTDSKKRKEKKKDETENFQGRFPSYAVSKKKERAGTQKRKHTSSSDAGISYDGNVSSGLGGGNGATCGGWGVSFETHTQLREGGEGA